MKFELDDILIDDILFNMENQEGAFLLDTHEGLVVCTDNPEFEDIDFDDEERFISLPDWSSHDGYRLMEKFVAELRNPIARQELSGALNRSKGVFRAFKNVLEQYPETETLWFKFKEQKMKNEVINWYNSLREEWGLEPIGSEPEDTSSLVLEDFVLRPGDSADTEKAYKLHKLCLEEKENKTAAGIYESLNKFEFPGSYSFVAESADGNFAGFIYAVKDGSSCLQIRQLEVKGEYRGMGLGKTLLAKLLEKTETQGLTITIDLSAGTEFFSRALHLEGFKPCVQRFVRR